MQINGKKGINVHSSKSYEQINKAKVNNVNAKLKRNSDRAGHPEDLLDFLDFLSHSLDY